MTSDVYRKVGRGGAGNFYSRQDIETAEKSVKEDVEAQNSTEPTDHISSSRPLSDYAHSGRGGAGNWYSPPELEKEGTFDSPVQTPVKDSATVGMGYRGRGGAGNYITGDETTRKEAEQRAAKEAKKREDEVVRDVEMGLKPPEKAYLTAERSEW